MISNSAFQIEELGLQPFMGDPSLSQWYLTGWLYTSRVTILATGEVQTFQAVGWNNQQQSDATFAAAVYASERLKNL